MTTTTTTTTTSTSAPVPLGDPPIINEERLHQQQLLSSRPPHPTARAFFEALDGAKKTHSTITTTSGASEAKADHSIPSDVHESQNDDHSSSSSSSSAWIQKRIQTLGWRNRYSQADQYPLQISNNNDNSDGKPYSFSVQQVQRGEVEGTYGTGATVWPASLVLLYYLQRQQQQHQQQKQVTDGNKQHDEHLVIVELGAGTGVVSIGAALIFGGQSSTTTTKIICTDGCEPVVQLARDNIRQAAQQLSQPPLPLNHDTDGTSSSAVVATIHECPIQVKHYWWGAKPLPTESSDTSTVDEIENGTDDNHTTTNSHTTTTAPKTRTMVLVSDCVLPKLYPIAPLVEALDQLLSRDSRNDDVAYISYEHRYFPEYDPRDKFRELCHAKGLQVIHIPMEEQHSVYSIDDIELWKVQRNPLKEV